MEYCSALPISAFYRKVQQTVHEKVYVRTKYEDEEFPF